MIVVEGERIVDRREGKVGKLLHKGFWGNAFSKDVLHDRADRNSRTSNGWLAPLNAGASDNVWMSGLLRGFHAIVPFILLDSSTVGKARQTRSFSRVRTTPCIRHCEAADHSAVEAIATASSLRDGVPKRGRSNLRPGLLPPHHRRTSRQLLGYCLAMTMQFGLLRLCPERILAMTDASAEVNG